VSIDITKRVEVRKVIGFVALFLPTGLVVCTSGPLVNATLDLVTTYTTHQNPGYAREPFNPYHRDCKGHGFEWDRVKVIIKDNADVVLVLKPRNIENFLDYGVSIWITWAPAQVDIL
jgi:hypothetical protein